MNKVELTGRITKDVELKKTSKGLVYARYILAVDHEKNNGADFIPCVVWGESAEWAAKALKKGSCVDIVGRLATGSYESDGKRIYTWNVSVYSQHFHKNQAKPEPNAEINDGFMVAEPDFDNLPFN